MSSNSLGDLRLVRSPSSRMSFSRIEFHVRRRSKLAAIMAFGCLTTTACSIPQEGNVQSIDPANIPYELNATTTSTTLVPELPSTTSGESTGDGAEPSVETVNLFFIAGTQVVPISRLLLSPASANQVLASLIEGLPPGDEAAGLRTAIPNDSNLEILVERGIARVDLPSELTSAIPGSEQRLAIAQIVLTLTRRAGIGQVVFTSGGRPQSVPRGRGDLTQPGGAVACEDYSNLLPAGFAC
ncbi:MAG: hypothetical protein RLZ37_2218 [Actinomycetota bacterium]